MPPVFLIGFMGSGKTTLGRALAAASCHISGGTRLRFIDLDEWLEDRHGMTVRQMFDRHGEAWFRSRETEALRHLSAMADVVIACGGGTPCSEGNMELMNRRGTTVLLEASHEALMRRLLAAQEQRPLLRGLDAEGLSRFIAAKQAERMPWYSQARLRFPSDRLETPQEVADSAARFFEMLGPQP